VRVRCAQLGFYDIDGDEGTYTPDPGDCIYESVQINGATRMSKNTASTVHTATLSSTDARFTSDTFLSYSSQYTGAPFPDSALVPGGP
jgi:hypothetical protein